jgi:hypothetical protein
MARWCVVDSNYLRTEALATFLAADPANKALLTEEAGMEAHKGDSLATLASSLAIVSRFRRQVAILRGARELSVAQAANIVPREALVDLEATQTFQAFCDVLPRALAGDKALAAQIQSHAAGIQEHLAAAEQQSASLAESIQLIIKELPAALIKELRSGRPVSRDHAGPIIGHIVTLTQEIHRKHPLGPQALPLGLEHLRETILFRKSLSTYLLVLDWIAKGGYTAAKPPTFANDLRDAMQAAWATYFDGFLTTDRKAAQIYHHTLIFLKYVFPRADGA